MKLFIRSYSFLFFTLAPSVYGRPVGGRHNFDLESSSSINRFPQDLGRCGEGTNFQTLTIAPERLSKSNQGIPGLALYEGIFRDPLRQNALVDLKVKLYKGGKMEISAEAQGNQKPSMRELHIRPINQSGQVSFPEQYTWSIDAQGYGVCNVATSLESDYVDGFHIAY